ncbi:hypothetical protein [Clostridium intestinale]|uniref:Uncharacterized protein n=1 Tax=Clostridium intestinale TaxID=36845 RepID=A0A7D6VXB0_9CLOT|nr:hypothetical protein [Clostridium intestinale]QLY81492.1 hypothetical protein HZF06_07880 [Clostridium intestinale]
MIRLIKISKLVSQYSNYMKVKLQGNKLVKKAGDDKLVISLVLIAVGVVLCFLYRNQIISVLTNALTALNSKIDNMFDGTVDGPENEPTIPDYGN